MGFESKGLARIALALLFGYVASWLFIGVLIVVSITSPRNQVVHGLLLVWALVAAGWLAVCLGREHAGTAWWQLALRTPARLIFAAIIGIVRMWRR
jgi:hypothetical protein